MNVFAKALKSVLRSLPLGKTAKREIKTMPLHLRGKEVFSALRETICLLNYLEREGLVTVVRRPGGLEASIDYPRLVSAPTIRDRILEHRNHGVVDLEQTNEVP